MVKVFRSTSNNVIYAERIVPGLNRFYSGHFQNAPNIKTFFGCVILEIKGHTQFCSSFLTLSQKCSPSGSAGLRRLGSKELMCFLCRSEICQKVFFLSPRSMQSPSGQVG